MIGARSDSLGFTINIRSIPMIKSQRVSFFYNQDRLCSYHVCCPCATYQSSLVHVLFLLSHTSRWC